MIRDKNGLTLNQRRARECAQDGNALGYVLYMNRYILAELDEKIEAFPRHLPWWRFLARRKQLHLLAEYGRITLNQGLIEHVVNPNGEM